MKRIHEIKVLLKNVEGRSKGEIAKGLMATSFPEGNLQIMEAVAQTCSDIAKEYAAEKISKKKWLCSMVQLNMAYLQLEGVQEDGSDTSLNILIRRKLKRHLSPDLLNDPRLVHALE